MLELCTIMLSFLQCWGLNPGLFAHQVSALPTKQLGCTLSLIFTSTVIYTVPSDHLTPQSLHPQEPGRAVGQMGETTQQCLLIDCSDISFCFIKHFYILPLWLLDQAYNERTL